MTQQEIQERNEQITIMLGAIKEKNFWNQESYRLEQFKRLSWSNMIQDNFENPHFTLSELKFHSDWNWLIEAVEFICGTLGYRKYSYLHEEHSRCVFTDMAILSQKHDFGGGNIIIDSGKQNTEREAVFIAVSDFAKKFNNKEL